LPSSAIAPFAAVHQLIEACIAKERRATNESPDPRAFTSELPNIGCAGINKAKKVAPKIVARQLELGRRQLLTTALPGIVAARPVAS
jgi:hypothetical protein